MLTACEYWEGKPGGLPLFVFDSRPGDEDELTRPMGPFRALGASMSN